MSKKENATNDTYIVEEAKQSSLKAWLSSRPAKIAAITVGSAVAIGAAFTGGVVAAKTILPQHEGPGFAVPFDRDGDRDHQPPIGGKGHHNQDRGHEQPEQEGGGRDLHVEPNMPSAPAPAPAPTNTP
jgi:hypothetical protein